MMVKQVSAHLLITGMVQGVGYRWFVMRRAKESKLAGWVRNLPDGEVEVEVEAVRVQSQTAQMRHLDMTGVILMEQRRL